MNDDHWLIAIPPATLTSTHRYECGCDGGWRVELAADHATRRSKGSLAAWDSWAKRTVDAEFAEHVAEASAGQPQPVEA